MEAASGKMARLLGFGRMYARSAQNTQMPRMHRSLSFAVVAGLEVAAGSCGWDVNPSFFCLDPAVRARPVGGTHDAQSMMLFFGGGF